MMKMKPLKLTWTLFEDYGRATALVFATVLLILIIGRETLGPAVIGLLYLVPIGYCAARWGQWPGICAAVLSALTFDFFFIPPYYTFTVGSVEGWLLLVIFLVVAVVIVGRIQSGLTRAQQREQEARLLYELSTRLIGIYGPEAVAQTLADYLSQLYQTAQVQVSLLPHGDKPGLVVTNGRIANPRKLPDRTVPLYSAAHGLIGEILLWANEEGPRLPAADERLVQTMATLGTLTLERAG